jgi:hypothetical protein
MRSNKILPLLLAGLGGVLLATAAVLARVVAPSRTQLPADTDTVRDLTGTARVLLDPQAVASGDLPNALAINVPVTAQRAVKVLATDGSAAKVSDGRSSRPESYP